MLNIQTLISVTGKSCRKEQFLSPTDESRAIARSSLKLYDQEKGMSMTVHSTACGCIQRIHMIPSKSKHHNLPLFRDSLAQWDSTTLVRAQKAQNTPF